MSDTKKTALPLSQRPENVLTGIGQSAWQAYNAMETTKRRHYEYLEIVDNKKKNFNLDPTPRDKHVLNYLLADHDEQVKRFTSLSVELKQRDAEGHAALFQYIGELGEVLSPTPTTH